MESASKAESAKPRVEIYDTTLRDGTQGEGVNLSLVDKLKITEHLDALGIDYIEGGYPLSNPKDAAYFEQVQQLDLKHSKICAFGMTRRKGISPADDVGMQALVEAKPHVITIVGKTWDLHVDEVLRVDRDENLAMIQDSLAFCRDGGSQVMYDAEHFFDGYRANPEYALQTLRAALAGGAFRLVLCDTNGGSLTSWVTQVIGEVRATLADEMAEANAELGIHTHNDGGLATANSLAAVEAGCIQVQGTINGVGERCGNVDLTTVIANLQLKMGYDCLHGAERGTAWLTETSRYVYELANMNLVPGQPFVGPAAFAHKGGMHVHAVQRIAHSYEHVPPESVGNTRRVLVSELSGASNISATLGEKFKITDDKAVQRKLLERVQDLEHEGYQFEAAEASFELLLHEILGQRPSHWELDHYRCVILKLDGDEPTTEAIVKMRVNDVMEHHVAEGDGPVNALDGALRKALRPHFPQIANVHLRDFKVRVVNPTAETAARVRVMIQFAVADGVVTDPSDPNDIGSIDRYFTTTGVSENIIEASWKALVDAFDYHLIESSAKQPADAQAEPVTA